MRSLLCIYIVLFLFSSFLVSCDKPKLEEEEKSMMYINLNINAMYLDDSDHITVKTANASRTHTSKNTSVYSSLDSVGNDFYLERSLEEKTYDSSRSLKNLKFYLKNRIGATSGSTMPTDINHPKYKRMEAGVKYMVLIFDNNENHIGTTIATVGENTLVPVKYKSDYQVLPSNYYRVVAFTFNTKDASDFSELKLDPSQTNNNPRIVFPSDKEFFYHNDNFLLDPQVNYQNPPILNIIFFPQTVKVGITIDARGANSKVKKVAGTFGSFGIRKTARFDLKLNNVIETVNVSESSFPYNFTVDNINSDTVSIARYVYMNESEGTDTLRDFSVVLKELVLQRDNDLSATTVLSSPNTKSYNFGSIGVKKNKYFNGRIDILSGFQVDNIVWAYGNLYYENDKYGFRASPADGRAAETTDYWQYKALKPGGVGNYNLGDPCLKVFPLGTWRLPTLNEYDRLYKKPGHTVSRHEENSIVGNPKRYTQISYSTTTNETRSIRFYSFGYYTSSIIHSVTSENLESFHWLDKRATTRDTYTSTTTASSGGIIGVSTEANYLATCMLNIRCVREIRN